MLGIQARANRRGYIADQRFGDSIKAERARAQAILEQANRSAKQQTCGGITTAQAEINSNQQRKLENFGPVYVNRQKCLQHERQCRGRYHSPVAKLVNLNVLLERSAEFHRLVGGGGRSGFPRSWIRNLWRLLFGFEFLLRQA